MPNLSLMGVLHPIHLFKRGGMSPVAASERSCILRHRGQRNGIQFGMATKSLSSILSKNSIHQCHSCPMDFDGSRVQKKETRFTSLQPEQKECQLRCMHNKNKSLPLSNGISYKSPVASLTFSFSTKSATNRRK